MDYWMAMCLRPKLADSPGSLVQSWRLQSTNGPGPSQSGKWTPKFVLHPVCKGKRKCKNERVYMIELDYMKMVGYSETGYK